MKTHTVRNTLVAALALCAAATIPAPRAQAQTFGGFGPQSDVETGTTGVVSGGIAVGDFDMDGDIDAIIPLRNNPTTSSTVYLITNDGTGGAAFPVPIIFTSNDIGQTESADFNNDGVLDLIFVHRTQHMVSVYLGDGAGGFQFQWNSNHISEATGNIAIDDIDLDGDTDIIYTSQGYSDNPGSTLHLLLNNGDATFINGVTITVGIRPGVTATGDYNSDGLPDIATTILGNINNGDSVAITLNQGNGQFGSVRLVSVTPNVRSIASADLNSDGHLDFIVSSTMNTSGVNVLFGIGDGTFSAPIHYNIGSAVRSIRIADADGDNDLDIALVLLHTTAASDDTIGVLINDGSGLFSLSPIESPILGISGFKLDTWDNNISPDVLAPVVVSTGGSGFSFLLNQAPIVPPSAFDLLSPMDGSAGLPIPDVAQAWPGGIASQPATWSTAMGFDTTYTFTIATDPALANVVFQQAGLTATTTDVPTGVINVSTRYYWGVTAVNQAGATPATSGAFTFTTATPADLNNDGVVNGADLATLLTNWGVLP